VNVSEQSAIKQLDVESADIDASFPGHVLRNARKSMGLSKEELSRQLHLTPRILEAIEIDDFSTISNAIFARGYIRNYARYVGADSDVLINAFDHAYGRPDHIAKPMVTIKDVKKQASSGDTWVRASTGLFLVIFVVLTLLWWQGQHVTLVPAEINKVMVNDEQGHAVVAGSEATTASIKPADQTLELAQLDTEAEAESASADSTQSNSFIEQSELVQISESIVVQDNNKVTVTDQTESPGGIDMSTVDAVSVSDMQVSQSIDNLADVVDTAVVQSANEAQLLMIFDNDCWVEVKNGDGNVVVASLLKTGQTVDMAIVAPVELLLGRVSALAKITFDGDNIDLTPYIGKDVAQITLGK
jgi:cytoskeleton protein RodZ